MERGATEDKVPGHIKNTVFNISSDFKYITCMCTDQYFKSDHHTETLASERDSETQK